MQERSTQLLAFDLDGTLLRSDGGVSERTLTALHAAKQAGLHLLSVTARPPRRLRRVARRLRLTGIGICSNGALTLDIDRDYVLATREIDPDAAHRLIDGLRRAAPGIAFAVETATGHGCEPHYRIPAEHEDDIHDPVRECTDAKVLCRAGVTKLIVQHPDYTLDALLTLTRELAGDMATVTHSGSDFVEVAAACVTKALALEAYCREHGIAQQDVTAFGDMPNDLPMLQWSGRGIAVANAHPEVLRHADEMTLSNDQDGVALIIERMLQQRNSSGVASDGRPASNAAFDPETLRFYKTEVVAYAQNGWGRVSPHLPGFLDRLTPGAHILELGCGAGRDSAYMMAAGFAVEPTDGVPEMAAEATRRLGYPVRVMRFDELDAVARYDAIWANASLLHVPSTALPNILHRVWRALKPGGWHFANYKRGDVEGRDGHGRYFNYSNSEAVIAAYRKAGDWAVMGVQDYVGGSYGGVQVPWVAMTVQRPTSQM